MTELDESDREHDASQPTVAEGSVEALEDLLAEIADGLGLEVEVEVEQTAEALTGRLEGQDVGLFIGRRGQTIDAVQHLAQRIVFHDAPSPVRVVIDADGYRERRAQALRADADDAADEVAQTSRAVELDPMPASERRVVHEHLRDRDDVETHSEGDEPDRYLVITARRGPALRLAAGVCKGQRARPWARPRARECFTFYMTVKQIAAISCRRPGSG